MLAPASARAARPALAWLLLGCGFACVSGCTVITVASAATSVAVGAVKLTGSAIGTAVDLVIPDGDDKKK